MSYAWATMAVGTVVNHTSPTAMPYRVVTIPAATSPTDPEGTVHHRTVVRPRAGRAVLACRCGTVLDLADMHRPRRHPLRQRSGIGIDPIRCRPNADAVIASHG